MGAKRTFFWEELPPDKLWYFVGLITSDGCLSKDGRHIDVTAQDKTYLQELCAQLELNTPITQKKSGYTDGFGYRIQFSSKSFYDFLKQIGLTPKKSKTIGALKIPDEFFASFARGVIDGDGSIRNWLHPQNKKEQWIVKIVSGSEPFLIWMQNKIETLYGIKGIVHKKYSGSTYTLKFGKIAAQELLKYCYPKEALALPRKMVKAQECIASKKGWSKSKTIRSIARVVELVDTQDCV